MKLFVMPVAPNPAKVLLYLAERAELGTQLPVETVPVDFREGEQNSPAHLERSPFGTVPVLELDDGSYLFESRSIIDYLEEKFPDGALLAGSVEARAHARQLERVVEQRVALPMIRYVHATNSPLGLPPDAKVAADIASELPRSLAYVEQLLSDGRELLSGDRVTVADCTLAAGCQFVRFGGADLLDGYPGIQAWDRRYRERPAAKAVLVF